MTNLAIAVVTEDGLDAWGGLCMEVADQVLHLRPDGAILYVEDLPDWTGWKYHAAAVVDGLVHCPWFPALLPPKQYVADVFGPRARWEIIGGEAAA